MKRLIFVLFFFPTFVFSQIGGTSTYKFLDLTNSAHIAALGGSNVSLSEPNSVFSNPALMDSSTANHLNFSYVNYFTDINWGYSSYNFSKSKFGYFAVGIQYINYGDFIAADELGNITGDFTAADYSINFAWANKIDSFFTVGIVLKPVFSNYESYTSFGIATDIGLSYFSRNKLTTAGLVIRNLGSQIKPYTPNNYEPLPFDIQIGFTQKFAHAPFRFSVLAHHLNKPDLGYVNPENNILSQQTQQQFTDKVGNIADLTFRHLIFGAEIIPSKYFYIAFGFNYQRRQELKLTTKTGLSGFSGGLGINVKKFSFNYAIAKYHLAGSTHNFTIALNINELFKRNFGN